MFSSSFRSLFVSLVLAAAAVSASPSLSLSLAGPTSVRDVENLRVVATITNTGTETVRILDDPRTLTSTSPADKFSVSGLKGRRPDFTGIFVKYSPEAAAKLGAYTTLAPGASVEVTHNLGDAYDFTTPGVGSYNFEGDNTFYVVKDDGSIAPILASNKEGSIAPATYSAKVEGNLAISRRSDTSSHLRVSKRSTFRGCTAERQEIIEKALIVAGEFAAEGKAYLEERDSTSERYATWFGAYTTQRRNLVLDHFTKIAANDFSEYTWDCYCTDSSYAYVYRYEYGVVYFCNAFWRAPLNGTDSQAGTIVHEASHFSVNGGTNDHAYGQTRAKNLAISNPSQAVMNADSHEYFVENNPWLA